jgi:hypothetical protein
LNDTADLMHPQVPPDGVDAALGRDCRAGRSHVRCTVGVFRRSGGGCLRRFLDGAIFLVSHFVAGLALGHLLEGGASAAQRLRRIAAKNSRKPFVVTSKLMTRSFVAAGVFA